MISKLYLKDILLRKLAGSECLPGYTRWSPPLGPFRHQADLQTCHVYYAVQRQIFHQHVLHIVHEGLTEFSCLETLNQLNFV